MKTKLASRIPADILGNFLSNKRHTMYSTTATNASRNKGLENLKNSEAVTIFVCQQKRSNGTMEAQGMMQQEVITLGV